MFVMGGKDFKDMFNDLAVSEGFTKNFGGWFKEDNECIIVLDLQKSNFGNYYELNIKIFIQGVFGNTYIKNKNLVKKSVGDVFRRQPNEYKNIFDLDIEEHDNTRKEELSFLFKNFVTPFTNKALTRVGIIELFQQGEVALLPAVKKELGI